MSEVELDLTAEEEWAEPSDAENPTMPRRTRHRRFFFEDGNVGFSTVALKALPKFMTYRIPLVRGEEKPYKDWMGGSFIFSMGLF